MTGLLFAWRPFLEPLPLHGSATWLYIPLVLLVAIVLRSLRTDHPREMVAEAGRLALQVTGYLVAAALLIWIVAEFL